MKSPQQVNCKVLRTILSVLCITSQVSLAPAFAVEPAGVGSQMPQPTCTLGNCSSSSSQNSNGATSSNNFMQGQTLSQATTQKTFEVRQGQSIQAAINQSTAGDIIRVYGGSNGESVTYKERLTLKAGLTLEAAGKVEIDLNDGNAATNDVLYMKNDTTVTGFTFRYGNATAARVLISFDYAVSRAVLENCAVLGMVEVNGSENILRGNTIRSAKSGTLRIRGGANQIVKNILIAESYFTEPAASQDQGVVEIGFSSGASRITGRNVLDGNTLYGFGQGRYTFGGNPIYSVGIKVFNAPLGVFNAQNIIVNAIIANSGRRSIEGYLGASSLIVSYSILDKPSIIADTRQGILIGVDPQFVNAAAGDFNLKPISPAINAGDPNSSKDADGTRRDIGAIAFAPRTFEIRQGDSLQIAIASARPGDVIRIHPGTYTGLSTYNLSTKSNITIEGVLGSNGEKPVIITNSIILGEGAILKNVELRNSLTAGNDPSKRGNVLIGNGGISNNVTVENVTLLNLSGRGNNLTIRNSEMKDVDLVTDGSLISGNKMKQTIIRGSNNRIERNVISIDALKQFNNQQCYSTGRGVTCINLPPTYSLPSGLTISGVNASGGTARNNIISSNTIYGYGVLNGNGTLQGGVAAGILFENVGTGNAVTNTIIANWRKDIQGGSQVSVTYSLLQYAGQAGQGNIVGNAQFVDEGGKNFQLKSTSPAIDAGDPNSPKDPDGTRADIGALAFKQSTGLGAITSMTTEQMRLAIENSHGFGAGSVTASAFTPVKKTVNGVVYDGIEVKYTLITSQGVQSLQATLIFVNRQLVTIADYKTIAPPVTQEDMRRAIEGSHGFGPGSVKALTFTPVKRTANGTVYDGMRVIYTLTTPAGVQRLQATIIFLNGKIITIADYAPAN